MALHRFYLSADRPLRPLVQATILAYRRLIVRLLQVAAKQPMKPGRAEKRQRYKEESMAGKA